MMTLNEVRERVAARRSLPDLDGRRELRRRNGLSLEEIAQVVGVSKVTVSKWERGVCEPRGDHLRAYVEVLGVLRGRR